MTRQTVKKIVDKVKAINYKNVANGFFGGATVAKEYEYWNAAGVLIVHSAIAYADAICIKNGGVKCQGEDHLQVVSLLAELLPSNVENKKAFNHLEKIIAHKSSVSYSGNIYDEKDLENLWKNIERFKTWAESQLSD
jgi:hypothetical protein